MIVRAVHQFSTLNEKKTLLVGKPEYCVKYLYLPLLRANNDLGPLYMKVG
jgi:hypothetical protein